MSADTGTNQSGERLKGRVAVITGASHGLGVTIAQRLVAEGAKVALMARTRDKLEAVAAQLGDEALAVPCDISNPDAVRAAFEDIAQRFGHVDLLVNNAGLIGMSLLEEADDRWILDQVATNLIGPMLCTRSAIPLLREAGGGDVINISSRSVELARPYLSVSSATKGGLEVFSRTLAAELRPIGIRVCAIRVGPIATAPTVQGVDSGTQSVTEEWVARGGPAPEPPAPPESVADAVVFIATTLPGARIPVIYLEPR
jgi:meso-butanediol dehydrogenase / (S,S)-butanediol dehydrogenase / diacetyl reductase